jgi:hypothetical protein
MVTVLACSRMISVFNIRPILQYSNRRHCSQMPINGDFAKIMGYLTSVIFPLGLYCTFGSNLMTQVSTKLHVDYGHLGCYVVVL